MGSEAPKDLPNDYGAAEEDEEGKWSEVLGVGTLFKEGVHWLGESVTWSHHLTLYLYLKNFVFEDLSISQLPEDEGKRD